MTELHISVSILLSNLTDRPSSPQLDLVLRDRIMSAVFLSSIVEKRVLRQSLYDFPFGVIIFDAKLGPKSVNKSLKAFAIHNLSEMIISFILKCSEYPFFCVLFKISFIVSHVPFMSLYRFGNRRHSMSSLRS